MSERQLIEAADDGDHLATLKALRSVLAALRVPRSHLGC